MRFGNSLGRSFSHPLQLFSILCSSKQAYGLTLQQASRALAAFGIKSLRDGVTSTKHVVHTPDGTPVMPYSTTLKEEALERCGTWHSPIPDILQQTPVDLVSGYPVYDRDLITGNAEYY